MSAKTLPCDREGWHHPTSSRGGTSAQWQGAVKEEVAAEDCYAPETVEWLELYIGRPEDADDTFLDVGELQSELLSDFGREFGAGCESDEDHQRAQRQYDEARCLIEAAAMRLPDEA